MQFIQVIWEKTGNRLTVTGLLLFRIQGSDDLWMGMTLAIFISGGMIPFVAND